MSRRRERKGHAHKRLVTAYFAGLGTALAQNPLKSVLVGVLSIMGLWLVLTKSLPYALAPTRPDAALALNPNNPAALLAKAEELRAKLVDISGVDPEKGRAAADAKREERSNTLLSLPEAKQGENELAEREDLRAEIRDLALRALSNDRLNARAYRALAEVFSDADQTRYFMQKAFERSRRETIAAFWLINDSYYRKDFKAVLRYSDMVLRTRPELGTYVYSYLSLIAAEPDGRTVLVEKLASRPPWRQEFLQVFPRTSKQADAPFLVMAALKDAGQPVSDKELAPYLNFLINADRMDAAYNAWLQFMPAAQVEKMELLTNGRFENMPSGLPFDWSIAPGKNAIADFAPLGNNAGNAFHIKFGDGRVQFPQISQYLFLPPGRYRLEGNLRGSISGKRGLRWQIRCVSGSQKILGETEMLLGQSPQWRVFSFDAEAPQLSECTGEIVRLIHDARSASEELLSGEVWFSDLHLTHMVPVSSLWTPVQ